MLIHSNLPPVSADTHDHAGRRANHNDAARVHTPIASNATSSAVAPSATPSTSAPSTLAPTARNAPRPAQPENGTATANP